MNWYRKSQEIYRGDPNPIDIKDFDSEYATKQLGKSLGSSLSEGPGIYFTTNQEDAKLYGSNITKLRLNNARILTEDSKKFSFKQIEKLLNNIDKEKIRLAASNWDENYNVGYRIMVQSIMDESNPIDQLINIWANVFYHQHPNQFMEVMKNFGIDGFAKVKQDATYYVIYNKEILQ
ncbi:MAG: hypothetical protein WC375_13030 [Methanomassiliicoccales archaeon]|jgi:hypothetical protein